MGRLGIDQDQKMELVYEYTGGRTTSSSQMTITECDKLIAALSQQQPDGWQRHQFKDPHARQRGKMLMWCHQLGWEVRDGKKYKVDYVRLNNQIARNIDMQGQTWDTLNAQQLNVMVNQLEAIYRKTHL